MRVSSVCREAAQGRFDQNTWILTSRFTPSPLRESFEKRYHARCVRGAAPQKQSLTNNNDGSVTDRRTGLTWQQKSAPGSVTWADAAKACPAQWRLPTIKELQSLTDESAVRPAINPHLAYLAAENPRR